MSFRQFFGLMILIVRHSKRLVAKCSAKDCVDVQELSEESSAAERYQNPAEELCRVPQTQELAMVETLH